MSWDYQTPSNATKKKTNTLENPWVEMKKKKKTAKNPNKPNATTLENQEFAAEAELRAQARWRGQWGVMVLALDLGEGSLQFFLFFLLVVVFFFFFKWPFLNVCWKVRCGRFQRKPCFPLAFFRWFWSFRQADRLPAATGGGRKE